MICFPKLKRSRDTSHIRIECNIIMDTLVLLCINQHTKFKVRSFTDSNDMVGAKVKKRVT